MDLRNSTFQSLNQPNRDEEERKRNLNPFTEEDLEIFRQAGILDEEQQQVVETEQPEPVAIEQPEIIQPKPVEPIVQETTSPFNEEDLEIFKQAGILEQPEEPTTIVETPKTPIVTEPAKEEGFFRQAADLPVKFGIAVNDSVKALTDLFGADNAVSQNLKQNSEWYRSLLSAQALNDEKEIARILEEADDKGVLDQIGAGLQAFAVAPLDMTASGLGSLATFVATGAAGRVAALARASKLGLVGAESAAYVDKFVRATQGLTGAGMGMGIVKSEIYDSVKQEMLDQGKTEEEAKKIAMEAQAYDGKNLDQILIAGGLGAVDALTGANKVINKVLTKSGLEAGASRIKNIITNGITEAAPEAIQAAQEKFASNLALQREGVDVDLTKGLVSQATLEGVVGGVLGTVAGGVEPRVAPINNATTKVSEIEREAIKEEELKSKATAIAEIDPTKTATERLQERSKELQAKNIPNEALKVVEEQIKQTEAIPAPVDKTIEDILAEKAQELDKADIKAVELDDESKTQLTNVAQNKATPNEIKALKDKGYVYEVEGQTIISEPVRLGMGKDAPTLNERARLEQARDRFKITNEELNNSTDQDLITALDRGRAAVPKLGKGNTARASQALDIIKNELRRRSEVEVETGAGKRKTIDNRYLATLDTQTEKDTYIETQLAEATTNNNTVDIVIPKTKKVNKVVGYNRPTNEFITRNETTGQEELISSNMVADGSARLEVFDPKTARSRKPVEIAEATTQRIAPLPVPRKLPTIEIDEIQTTPLEGYTPSEKTKVSAGRKAATLRKVNASKPVEFLSNVSKQGGLKGQVADLLLKSGIGNAKVTIGRFGIAKNPNARFAGKYNRTTNEITINLDERDSYSNEDGSHDIESTLLHELGHAAFANKLKNKDTLDPAESKAIREIESIYERFVQEYSDTIEDYNGNTQNAFKSLEEFASEILVNPELQTLVEDLSPDKSILQKILQYILNFIQGKELNPYNEVSRAWKALNTLTNKPVVEAETEVAPTEVALTEEEELLSPAQINKRIKSIEDFFLSQERIPGDTANILSNLATGGYAMRELYHSEINNILIDRKTKVNKIADFIQKQFGINMEMEVVTTRPSLYVNKQGNIENNPSQIIRFTGKYGKQNAMIYGLAEAIVTKQNATAGFERNPNGDKVGAKFILGVDVNESHMEQFGNVITQIMADKNIPKGIEDFALVPDKKGIIVIHLGYNTKVDKDVSETVFKELNNLNNLLTNRSNNVRYFKANTEFYENNWTKQPNGNTFYRKLDELIINHPEYSQTISGTEEDKRTESERTRRVQGKSKVRTRRPSNIFRDGLASVLSNQIERVNAEFAASGMGSVGLPFSLKTLKTISNKLLGAYYKVYDSVVATPVEKLLSSLAGFKVMMIEADRQDANGRSAGGPLWPWLKSNLNAVAIDTATGIEYVAKWANLGADKVRSMRRRATGKEVDNGWALVSIGDAKQHQSNSHTFREVIELIEGLDMQPNQMETVKVILGNKLSSRAISFTPEEEIELSEREAYYNEIYGAGLDENAIGEVNKKYSDRLWYQDSITDFDNRTSNEEFALSKPSFDVRKSIIGELESLAFLGDEIWHYTRSGEDFVNVPNFALVSAIQLSTDPNAFAIWNGKMDILDDDAIPSDWTEKDIKRYERLSSREGTILPREKRFELIEDLKKVRNYPKDWTNDDIDEYESMSKTEKNLRNQIIRNGFVPNVSYPWTVLGPKENSDFIISEPASPLDALEAQNISFIDNKGNEMSPFSKRNSMLRRVGEDKKNNLGPATLIVKPNPTPVVSKVGNYDTQLTPTTAEGVLLSPALIAEARKYKSAEEFVKAQGVTVFHGSKKQFKTADEINVENGFYTLKRTDDDIARQLNYINDKTNRRITKIDRIKSENLLTTSEIKELENMPKWEKTAKQQKRFNELTNKAWEQSRKNEGMTDARQMSDFERDPATAFGSEVTEFVVDFKNPMVVDFNGKSWREEGTLYDRTAELIADAKKAGHDGIIIKNIVEGFTFGGARTTGLVDDYIVLDKNAIKTRSELTDIWNKAQAEFFSPALTSPATDFIKNQFNVKPKTAYTKGLPMIGTRWFFNGKLLKPIQRLFENLKGRKDSLKLKLASVENKLRRAAKNDGVAYEDWSETAYVAFMRSPEGTSVEQNEKARLTSINAAVEPFNAYLKRKLSKEQYDELQRIFNSEKITIDQALKQVVNRKTYKQLQGYKDNIIKRERDKADLKNIEDNIEKAKKEAKAALDKLPPNMKKLILDLRNELEQAYGKSIKDGVITPNTAIVLSEVEGKGVGFILPDELKKSAPRYGMATIDFESDLDLAAYVLANDEVKPSNAAAKFRKAIKDAGYDLDDVIEHGKKVKEALKQEAGGKAAPKTKIELKLTAQEYDGFVEEKPETKATKAQPRDKKIKIELQELFWANIDKGFIDKLKLDTETIDGLLQYIQDTYISNVADQIIRGELSPTEEELAEAGLKTKRRITKAQALQIASNRITDQEARNILEDFLNKAKDSPMDGFAKLAEELEMTDDQKLGGLPKVFKDALKPLNDAGKAYMQLMYNVSQDIINRDIFSQIRDMGLQGGWVYDPNDWNVKTDGPEPEGFVEVKSTVPGFSPIFSGLKVDPTFFKAVEDRFPKTGDMGPINKTLSLGNTLGQLAVTAYDVPRGLFRQLLGGTLFMIHSGQLNSDYISAFKSVITAFRRDSKDPESIKYVERLMELNLIDEDINMNRLRDSARGITNEDINSIGDLTSYLKPSKFKNISELLSRLYQVPDSFWRVSVFEAEKKTVRKAFPNMSERDVENLAAERTKEAMPTYARMNALGNMLRKPGIQNFLGAFVGFGMEVMRVMYSNANLAYQDMKSDNKVIRASGFKRLAGIVSAYSSVWLVGQMAKAMAGIGDDEEEAARRTMGYNKFDEVIWFRNKDGSLGYFSLSWLTPFSMLTSNPIRAAADSVTRNDDTMLNETIYALSNYVKEAFGSYLNLNIFSQRVYDVLSNPEQRIYNPEATFDKTTWDILSHLVGGIVPANAKRALELTSAITGTPLASGDVPSKSSALLNLALGKSRDIKPQSFLKSKGYELDKRLRNSAQLFTRPAKTQGPLSEAELINAYNQANQANYAILYEAAIYYRDQLVLGEKEQDVINTLKDKRLNKEEITQIREGIIRPYQASDSTLTAIGLIDPKRVEVYNRIYKEKLDEFILFRNLELELRKLEQ